MVSKKKQVATLFQFGFLSNTFDSHSEQDVFLSSSPPDEAVRGGDCEQSPRSSEWVESV